MFFWFYGNGYSHVYKKQKQTQTHTSLQAETHLDIGPDERGESSVCETVHGATQSKIGTQLPFRPCDLPWEKLWLVQHFAGKTGPPAQHVRNQKKKKKSYFF